MINMQLGCKISHPCDSNCPWNLSDVLTTHLELHCIQGNMQATHCLRPQLRVMLRGMGSQMAGRMGRRCHLRNGGSHWAPLHNPTQTQQRPKCNPPQSITIHAMQQMLPRVRGWA